MSKRRFGPEDVDHDLFKYKAEVELEMAAFDRLHWELRHVLRCAPIQVSAVQAEKLIKQGASWQRVAMMVHATVRQWRERAVAA